MIENRRYGVAHFKVVILRIHSIELLRQSIKLLIIVIAFVFI